MLQVERVAEANMEAFWSHHAAGHFDESMVVLGSLGYRQDALDFALDPSSYYFPNWRGDRLARPAGVTSDQLPVVALEKGSTYHFEKPSLHRLQRCALEAAGFSRPSLRDIERDFAEHNDTIGTAAGTASVYSQLTATKYTDGARIASKPALVFNIDRSEPAPTEFCPSVTLHELVHVVQKLANPLQRPSDRLRKDLEAYAVQAKLLWSPYVGYSDNLAAAATVEQFRQRYLGPNVYEPDSFFREEFQKNPAFSKILRSVAS